MESVYYELKQENMMLRRENMELARRLAQKHEPDVFIKMDRLNNMDCRILPFTLREFVRERKLG